MSELKRDDLERDLVRYDKQKLISECLKIFDSNKMLRDIVHNRVEQIATIEQDRTSLRVEVDRLKSRSIWEILNERTRIRLNKKKAINQEYKRKRNK